MSGKSLFIVVLSCIVLSACRNTCECVTTYTTNGEEVMPSVTRVQEVGGGSCSNADISLADKDANVTATTVCK